MNRKMGFAFTAIAILLASSISPVVGSERNLQIGNSKTNSLNSLDKSSKTIEVPVQIYTLHGVKEIKKELPVNEARELFSLSNGTAEAVKILVNGHATLKEKIRANEIVDSFLYKMKEYGLLGDLTIKQAKELITGKYLQKQRNSIEMRKMAMMTNLLENNGWKVNAMCYFNAAFVADDIFPWNALLWYILRHYTSSPILWDIAFTLLLYINAIPHPTTIGYWTATRLFGPAGGGDIYTLGLLGKKEVYGKCVEAITIGFTGVVLGVIGIGFCPFVAMREKE